MGPGKYNCDDLWQKDGESQPEVAMWTADFEELRSEWYQHQGFLGKGSYGCQLHKLPYTISGGRRLLTGKALRGGS